MSAHTHGWTHLLALPCRQATELASAAMDRELTRGERLALRLHLLTCRGCRRFRAQLAALRRCLVGLYRLDRADDLDGSGEDDLPFHMPPQTRARILQRLRAG